MKMQVRLSQEQEKRLTVFRLKFTHFAKTFSELRFATERVENKQQVQSITLGQITDANIASEYTNLAKNLLHQEASNHAIIHSRISAKNVFNLLV